MNHPFWQSQFSRANAIDFKIPRAERTMAGIYQTTDVITLSDATKAVLTSGDTLRLVGGTGTRHRAPVGIDTGRLTSRAFIL